MSYNASISKFPCSFMPHVSLLSLSPQPLSVLTVYIRKREDRGASLDHTECITECMTECNPPLSPDGPVQGGISHRVAST